MELSRQVNNVVVSSFFCEKGDKLRKKWRHQLTQRRRIRSIKTTTTNLWRDMHQENTNSK